MFVIFSPVNMPGWGTCVAILSVEFIVEQYLVSDVDLRSPIQKKGNDFIVTFRGRLMQRSRPTLKHEGGGRGVEYAKYVNIDTKWQN